MQETLTNTYTARKPRPPGVADPLLRDKQATRKRPSMQGKGTGGPSSQRTQSNRGAMPRSRLHRETSNFSQLDFLAAEVSNQPGVHKENKAPASFAGVKSWADGGSIARDRAAKAPSQQLTTFEDHTALRSTKEEAQPDALATTHLLMGILAHKQYSLPAPDKAQQPQPAAARPPLCGGSSSQRSSETAAWAAPTQAAELPASRRPALDWALRTRMRFCSSRPFRLCEDATLASGAWAGAAFSGQPASSLEERYQQALQTYQHPEAPMEQGLVTALGGARGGPAMLAQRRAAWDSAFSGLFQQLRNGATDAFYYVSPQDTRKTAFVVLFRGAGVGGCVVSHALVSRSSAGVRALLRAEGVAFAMPLAPQVAEQEAAEAELLADVEASNVGKAVTKDALTAIDGHAQSMLAVVGETDVAGLAEVLCNHGQRLFEAACDVPLLLAPTPFAGAHLTRLQPQVTVSSLAAKAGASRQRINNPTRFTVELEGLIPPWAADRLCIVLAEAQGEGKLQVTCEPLPLAGSLNAAVPQPDPDELGDGEPAAATAASDCSSGGGDAWQRRGYASPEEAERWRFAAPALAGGSVIGHVYTNGGRFYCRLRQARTAAPAAQRNHSGWQ